jgi:hypothetical protein
VIWLDKKIEDGDGVYHRGRWGHGDERTMDTNQEEHDAMLCFMPAGVLSFGLLSEEVQGPSVVTKRERGTGRGRDVAALSGRDNRRKIEVASRSTR